MSFKLTSSEMKLLLHRVQSMNNLLSSSSIQTLLLPFHCDNQILGYLHPTFAEKLTSYSNTFQYTDHHKEGLKFVPEVEVQSVSGRTAAALTVCQSLRENENLFTGWRSEMLAVASDFHASPSFLLERVVIPAFGVKAYGVHVNGYTTTTTSTTTSRPEGIIDGIWVARRSSTKPTWPGMLDHIAAGAIPHGINIEENVWKECAEEANIPLPLAKTAQQSFIPQPVDGEVDSFVLKKPEWVLDRLLRKDVEKESEYKPNCNLVVIDFFLRHGLIDRSSPHYEELEKSLHVPL
eukprot:scaffold2953_cov187-Ochromonas_danica.AAC.9